MAKPTIVGTVFSITISNGWVINNLMLKTHFSINGYLTKMVYMTQPPVFTNPTHIQHMCVKFKNLSTVFLKKKKKKISLRS